LKSEQIITTVKQQENSSYRHATTAKTYLYKYTESNQEIKTQQAQVITLAKSTAQLYWTGHDNLKCYNYRKSCVHRAIHVCNSR